MPISSCMSKKKNILYFIPHDLGDFLGCYGHTDVSSPNIDKFAAEGVRFTEYFTTAPECTPSRGSFATRVNQTYWVVRRGKLDFYNAARHTCAGLTQRVISTPIPTVIYEECTDGTCEEEPVEGGRPW